MKASRRIATVLLVVAFELASLATSRARAEERAPYSFDRVRTSAKMSFVPIDDVMDSFFRTVSMSPDGAFVALGRFNGSVEIWSIGGGAKTASLRLASGEDRTAKVVLLGSPCVAVTAVGERLNEHARIPTAAQPIEIWQCHSGQRVAQLRASRKAATNDLIDLVALPSCGLVVASFGDRIDVVDVASSSLRPDLSRLFDEARTAAIRTYPDSEPDGTARRASLKFAASSADDACVAFAAAYHVDAQTKVFVPAALWEFDLRHSKARLVRTVPHRMKLDGNAVSAQLVVSPGRRYAAISLDPLGAVWGGGAVAFVDLASDSPHEYFDGRRDAPASDLAFLNEDDLFLATKFLVHHTDATLLDRRAKRRHSLCHTVFGEPDIKKGNPRALAVNAKMSLLAVALHDEMRVFRYRRNANVRWKVKDCTND